ncbi:unnamed protein product [Phytophthora fragariaefolia]|uniref:Unnamed protein product n=1 Tax=Phytophthora fragariaefolia TaxID=1490495 RepID=A0A9W6Y1F4_9STRA|nr:unnamed protein product [Phytophthora fragariaefolia]
MLAVFYHPWGALGRTSSEHRLHATFELTLHCLPEGPWTLLDDVHRTDSAEFRYKVEEQVHQLLQWSWAIGATTTLQAIWRRRCTYYDSLGDSTAHTAAAILHARLRSAYQTTRSYASDYSAPNYRIAAAKLCHLALTHEPQPTSGVPLPARQHQCHILFFDGGSRGRRRRVDYNWLRFPPHHNMDGQRLIRIQNYQQHRRRQSAHTHAAPTATFTPRTTSSVPVRAMPDVGGSPHDLVKGAPPTPIQQDGRSYSEHCHAPQAEHPSDCSRFITSPYEMATGGTGPHSGRGSLAR